MLYSDDKISTFIFSCTYLILEYHAICLVTHYNLKYLQLVKPAIAISRAIRHFADQHRGRCTSLNALPIFYSLDRSGTGPIRTYHHRSFFPLHFLSL